MSKKVKDVEVKPTKVKKKHHVLRWVLISCLLIFIVGPVAFVFGAFYDTSTRNDLPDTYEKYEYNLAKSIGEGFSALSDTNHVFKMTLDENFGNSLMAAANEAIQQNATVSQFVKKLYCTMKDDKVDFYAELQASFFKTRVSIMTTLKTEVRDGEETYVFKIDNLKLGRLSINKALQWLLPKFIQEEQINGILKSLPVSINAKFSLANFEITYPKSSMRTDLGTILTKTFPDNTIGNILLGLFDDLNPKAYYSSGITFELDFSSINEPKFTVKHGLDNINGYKEDEKKYIEFCENSLNKGYIVADATEERSDSVQNLFTALLTGTKKTKDYFNDNLKTYFYQEFKKDFNSWEGNPTLANNRCSNIGEGITGTKYTDSKIEFPTDPSKIKDFVLNTDAGPETQTERSCKSITLCYLGDDLLSDYLRSIPLVGYNFPITMQTGENTYAVSLFSFDDMSANINVDTTERKNTIDLFSNLYLNGTNIPLTISTEYGSLGRSLIMKPTNIYFGSTDIGDLKNTLLSFVYETMKDSEGVFKMVKEDTGYYFDVAFDGLDVTSGIGADYKTFVEALLKGNETKKVKDLFPNVEGLKSLDNEIDMSKFELNINAETGSSQNVSTLKFTFTNKNSEIKIPTPPGP